MVANIHQILLLTIAACCVWCVSLATGAVATRNGDSLAALSPFDFKILPQPNFEEAHKGFLGFKDSGGGAAASWRFVCCDGFTSVNAKAACRAVGYVMPESSDAMVTPLPAFLYSSDAKIDMWNVNCANPTDEFPCSYKLHPQEGDCSNSVFIDCSQGQNPDAMPFVYRFIFAVPKTSPPLIDDFKTRVANTLISFIQSKTYSPGITVDRLQFTAAESIQLSSLPPAGGSGNIDDKYIGYAFNVSFTEGTYPTQTQMEEVANAHPFDMFPRDMRLYYARVKGTEGRAPAGPTYALKLVPTDLSRPWAGYVTVTPSDTKIPGTICSDGLGGEFAAALAICSALGFETTKPAIQPSYGQFDPERDMMPMVWRGLNCDGAITTEGGHQTASIDDCQFIVIEEQSSAPQCFHGIDVFVDCYSGGEPPKPPTPYFEWTMVLNISSLSSSSVVLQIGEGDEELKEDVELLHKNFAASIVNALTGLSIGRVGFTKYSVVSDTTPPHVKLSFVVADPPSSSSLAAATDASPRSYHDAALYSYAKTTGKGPLVAEDLLQSYLVLSLTSNSTDPEKEIPRVEGTIVPDFASLSEGNRGHLVIRKKNREMQVDEFFTGSGCTRFAATKDDAAALCTYLAPTGVSTVFGGLPRYVTKKKVAPPPPQNEGAEFYGDMLMQGWGCTMGQPFVGCFTMVPTGETAQCDYVSVMGAVCGHSAPQILGAEYFLFGSDEKESSRNVINFNVTVLVSQGVHFSWDNFMNRLGEYFAIDRSRFVIRHQVEGISYIFHISDKISAEEEITGGGVPRVQYEYFLMHLDVSAIDGMNVQSFSFFRGAPYTPPEGPEFIPTDTAGWQFRLDAVDSLGPNKGVLRIVPPRDGATGDVSGVMCSEGFNDHEGEHEKEGSRTYNAHALCKTLTGRDVPTAKAITIEGPNTNGLPFVASRLRCPDPLSGVEGCSMVLTPNGAPDSLCSSVSAPVYLDCSTVGFGSVNFTLVKQNPPATTTIASEAEIRKMISTVLEIEESRMEVTVAAVYTPDSSLPSLTPTAFYTVRFNDAQLNPSVIELERRLRSVTPRDVVERMGLLEVRASDVVPNGDVPSAIANLSPVPLTTFNVKLSSPIPSLFRRHGRIQLQPKHTESEDSALTAPRMGSVCDSLLAGKASGGLDFAESELASAFCDRASGTEAGSSSGNPPSKVLARFVKNIRTAIDINASPSVIYLGGAGKVKASLFSGANSGDPSASKMFEFTSASLAFYEKKDSCSHLGDLGLQCGREIRAPSVEPMIFRAHFALDSAIGDQNIAARALSFATGVAENGFVPIAFVTRTPEEDDHLEGQKYLEFSLADTADGFSADDNALAVLLINEEHLEKSATVVRLEITRDWQDPALTTTTTTTATRPTTSTTTATATTSPTTTADLATTTTTTSTPATTTATATATSEHLTTSTATAAPTGEHSLSTSSAPTTSSPSSPTTQHSAEPTSSAPTTQSTGATTDASPTAITTSSGPTATAATTSTPHTTTAATTTTAPTTTTTATRPTTTPFVVSKTLEFKTNLTADELMTVIIDTIRQRPNSGGSSSNEGTRFVSCTASDAAEYKRVCTVQFSDGGSVAEYVKDKANQQELPGVYGAAEAATEPPAGPEEGGGGNTGVIVGVVVGVIAAVALASVGFFVYKRSASGMGRSSKTYDDNYGPLELEAQPMVVGGDLNIPHLMK